LALTGLVSENKYNKKQDKIPDNMVLLVYL